MNLLVVAVALGCRPASPPEARPNLLLFTLDTFRADALSAYGNKAARTPALARIAEESTRFSRAFTVTPLTIPAHSSLFTSLYPPRHGVRDNGDFFLGHGAVTLAERLRAAGYATGASVGAEVTSHHWGFDQGFDAFFDDMGESRQEERNRWRVERRGDAVVDDALGWLAERIQEPTPWFAWVHLFDAHHPYEAPQGFADLFPDQPYLAEVGWVDLQVGRVMAALEDVELLDNTWVVVLADHGEGLGSHGEQMHGVLLYNATTRIPLLIRPPGGQAAPGFVHFPVSLVDVAPTLLSAAGLRPPDGIDGIDLTPWVLDPGEAASPADRAVYIESLYAERHYGWATQRALVTEQWKLIDSTTDELYARADLAEADDRVGAEVGPAEALASRVESLVAEMAPEEGLSDVASLSLERLAQLEALGYITGFEAAPAPEGSPRPDPVERLPILRDVERARQALRIGDVEGGLEALKAVIDLEPGLIEPRMMRALALRRQGKLEDALADLTAVEAIRPSSSGEAAMASVLLELGQIDDALRLLGGALLKDPYLSSAWNTYLHTLLMLGDMASLKDAVARARDAVPELLTVDVMAAHLVGAAGDAPSAAEAFHQVLAQDPTHPTAHYGLGLALRALEDLDGAESELLEEVSLYAKATPARRALVEIFAGQKRYDEQLEQLEVVAGLEPQDPLNWQAIGQALFNLKRPGDALTAIESCLDLAPSRPGCWLLKANALHALGRDDEARATFERAKAIRAAASQSGQPPSF